MVKEDSLEIFFKCGSEGGVFDRHLEVFGGMVLFWDGFVQLYVALIG